MHENSKWSQKGLKFQYVALNVACWMQKKSWVETSLQKWNVFVTDEFSSEPLYFERDGPVCRWSASSLYTKSSQLLRTCYVGQMMISCQVSTFLSSGCSPFQLQGHLPKNKSLNAWK